MRIEYVRDGLVEEFHEGYFVQLSDSSNLLQPYYLRSCAKPLQAALLIDYEIDFTEEELALCCGSHAGEECHIKIARGILNKLGLDESALKCGVHAPLARSMQDKMLLSGESAGQIHNNCSGKHLGFLAICKKMGWELSSYDEPSHPLQVAVMNKIYEMCEIELPPHPNPRPEGDTSKGRGWAAPYPTTTDGCGVPILSMPLKNMLIGYKNLLNYPKIINAILNHPYIFGGENRLDTEIIENSNGLIAKVGAGGLCIVMNIKEQDGFVVKINDCSMEARRIAVLEMINRLGWGKIDYDNKIRTIHDKIVGEKLIYCTQ